MTPAAAAAGAAVLLLGRTGGRRTELAPAGGGRLAAVDAASLEAERYWALYLSNWTRWNHVRTAGSGASAACLMMAAAILL